MLRASRPTITAMVISCCPFWITRRRNSGTLTKISGSLPGGGKPRVRSRLASTWRSRASAVTFIAATVARPMRASSLKP